MTEKEKEYLRNFIEPFKDRVKFITKTETFNKKYEFLSITVSSIIDSKIIETTYFPSFPKGKMYKELENNKGYTVEYLEL